MTIEENILYHSCINTRPRPKANFWGKNRLQFQKAKYLHAPTKQEKQLIICIMKYSNALTTFIGLIAVRIESLSMQRGRRRQRQLRKTMCLMSKNNRSARAFYILAHFFGVLCKTTPWDDHI